MQLTELMEHASQLSLYEIWRLNAFVRKLTEDESRLKLVRNALKPGMAVSYFCLDENRDIPMIVNEVRQTKAYLSEVGANRRWTVPIAGINIAGLDIRPPRGHKKGSLSKANLKVGDVVGYESKRGIEVFGHVIKLNPKRALIRLTTKEEWHVWYHNLFPVCEGELGAEVAGCIEGEVVERGERTLVIEGCLHDANQAR